ncbi:MAG: hypothetical protein ACR2MP_33210 [Streptosporangiaceae bacterium]
MARHSIVALARPADDGGTWLGVGVCRQCQPGPGDSPRRTFSAREPCPECGTAGTLEWRWSAEPMLPARPARAPGPAAG